jgi:hypothetical protein
MPRIDCFDIIKNNPELVSEFISITEDMPEVEQRKQAIQIVNKLLEASNESLNKVKRKVGQKPQKYNSGVSQDAIDEIIKKYSQPEQKETPQAESNPALIDVEPIRQLGTGANVYFETDKYRVNDNLKNGRVLLNIGDANSETPLANIEFDTANEAVFVAKKIAENAPMGLDAGFHNVNKIIENYKKEYSESLLSKEQTPNLKNEFQYVIDKANKAGGGVKGSGTKKINLSDREAAILNKTIEKLEAKAVANNGATFDPIETINIQYETINGKEQKINTYTVDGYSIKYRRGRNSFIEITTPQGDLLIVSKQYGKTEIAYLGKSEPIISKEQTPPALRDVESIAKKSDADIEKRMLELQDSGLKIGTPETKEFNALEKEMEKRERDSVFNVPLDKVGESVDALMQKEKDMPNGFGAFIEKRDARETKEVADKYLNAKELTDAELKKDFSDAVRGNPTTWYADGLKMREALKEATNRGIDTKDMLAAVTKVYEDAGYDTETAKSVVANMLKPIFEGSQKVETNESKLVKSESLLSNEQTQTQPTVSASGLLKYKKKSIAERFSKGLDATSVMEGGEIYPDDVTQRAAWRSMGKKEFEGLLSGNEIGGDAKKGGYFGDNPAIASAQKGEGKYLVEFGGKKVEGETTVGKVSLKDITGVWKYENDKWNKLDKEAVESLLSKEQTPQAGSGDVGGEQPLKETPNEGKVNLSTSAPKQSITKKAFTALTTMLKKAFPKVKFLSIDEAKKELRIDNGINLQIANKKYKLFHSTTNPISGEFRVKGKNNSNGIYFARTPKDSKTFGDITYKANIEPKNTLILNDNEVRKYKFFNIDEASLKEYLDKGYDSIAWYQNGKLKEFVVLDNSIIKNYDVHYLKTSKGEVFGFQSGNSIFIDPSLINADTPIHEVVGHYGMNIIDAMAKGGDEKAQAIIAKGFSLLQAPEGKAVLDEIKANPAYSNLSLREKKMEALATIIGREGANMFTEGTRKNTFASKVKDFIKSFYDYIRTKVPTLKDKTIKQIVAMDNKEFIRAIVGDAFRGEIVQQNNESLSDDIRFSNDYESSPQFKKWKGNNRLVSGDEVQDVKTGEPIVVKGYHGTTNEFYEFDSSVKGNVEGHLGKVNYFTSDEQDASSNYQADGADITSRVSRRSEYLEDYLYDEFGIVARQSPPVKVSELDYKKISDEFNIPISDLKKQKSSELYKYIAEKELKGNTEKVLDLYIKLNNPVVLGSGATWFETLNISDKDLEQAAQEIADENGVTIEEAKEDYEWDIRDRAIENTGYKNVALDALSDALESNGYDGQLASNILGDNIYDAEINLNDLEKRMRKAELYDNNEGEMAGSQVISDFFKNLGFDGIILTDVSDRFKNMGLGSTTSHIHVFDEFKNQIKLADGTNTTFNPNTNDIRFQASPKTDLQEAERKLKEAWGKYLSNGISFDGMAEAEKERQLIVALLGYLKAKGIDIAKGIGNEVRDFIKNKFSGVTDEMIDVAQGRMLTDYQKLYDTHMTPKNKEILDGMVSQVKSGEMSFEDFINTIDGIVPNERIKNVFISYVNEQIDPLDGYVAVDEEIEESPESPKTETSKEEERAFIGGLLARPINRKNFPNIVGDNKTDDDVLKRITAVTQEDVQDRKVMVDTSYVRVALENIKEIALQNANALYMQFGEDWQTKVMDYLSDYLNAANPAQAIGILNVISTDVQQKIEKSQSPTERTKLFKLQDKADELSILFASQASLGINARKILRQFAQGGNMSKLVLDKILTEDTMQTIEEINRIAASKPTNEELNNATLPVQAPQTPKSRIQKIKENVKAALSSKQKNKPKITEKEINELGRRAEEERKRQGVQTKMSRQQIAQMLKEEAKKC